MTHLSLRGALLAGVPFLLAAPAQAQDGQAAPPVTAQSAAPSAPQAAVDEEAEEDDIVVIGQRPRGSVIGDIPPENTLTGRDVRATGATNIT
jgi:hypothetical protein